MFTEVKLTEYSRGIPFASVDAVKAAITQYSEGRLSSSHATTRQLVSDGGDMIAMMLTLVHPSESSFLGKMFKEMDEALANKNNPRYHKSYDYDGVGVFHKTTVEVEQLKGGTCMLHLNAAYVGDKPEVDLAKALEINRGLIRTGISAPFKFAGDHFTLNCADLARRLGTTLEFKIDGEQLAAIIATGRSDYEGGRVSNAGQQTYLCGSLEVSVSLSAGSYYEEPYQSSGSTLTGPLQADWEDESKFKAPVISITIEIPLEKGASRYDREAVIDEGVKAQMRQLASKFQASFAS